MTERKLSFGGETQVMQTAVLGSGSKGNSVYIEMEGVHMLVDAGIGVRRVMKSLKEIGVTPDMLSAVFLTHEHTDHIKGLGPLMRATQARVYTRPGTLSALPKKDELPDRLGVIHDTMKLGPLTVRAFSTLHDAADPVGYSFSAGQAKCTLATDLGFITSSVQAAIEGSDMLVLETNHDPGMLKRGSYPWPLKQRILGNRGHLANEDAAWALVHMRKRPEKIFLAHLSEENNRPELARETVERVLKEQGADSLSMDITVARQNDMDVWM